MASDISQIVNVTITRDTKVPTRAGFGTPLIFGFHSFFPERCRLIGDPSELLDLGATTAHPVYRAALAIKSQSPSPPLVAIGRRALPFAMRVELAPKSTTPGDLYRFEAVSPGGVVTQIQHVVPEGATVDSVCDALIDQLDAVAGIDAGGDGTKIVTLTPTVTTEGFVYTFGVLVDDVETEIEHTNGAAETATTICDSFRTQINAIAGTTVVASGTTTAILTAATSRSFTVLDAPEELEVVESGTPNTKILLAAKDVGTVFDLLKLPKPSKLGVDVTTADPGIATDFAALMAEDPSRWYAITLDHASQAQVEALAPLISAQKKIALCGLSDSELFDAQDATCTASVLKAGSRSRITTFALGNQISGHHAAAMLGAWLPEDPGSETAAFLTLSGVTPDDLDTPEVLAAIGDGGSVEGKWFTVYTQTAGVNFTREGHVPDGDYLDTIRGVDWLEARLAEDVLSALTRLKKIPFTDDGIQLIVGIVRARLADGVRVGLLSGDPAPVVTFPRAKDVDPAAKARRLLPDLNFEATLAGAIHRVKIVGKVSL
jgi:hypothetical protein